MSIWYHFEDISHLTSCLLSNLFNYHGLIKFKFNRLLRLTIPDSLPKVRIDCLGQSVHFWSLISQNMKFITLTISQPFLKIKTSGLDQKVL